MAIKLLFSYNTKQLLDKATSDIKIYSVEQSIIRRGRNGELDNSLARLNESRYPTLPRPITVLPFTLTFSRYIQC